MSRIKVYRRYNALLREKKREREKRREIKRDKKRRMKGKKREERERKRERNEFVKIVYFDATTNLRLSGATESTKSTFIFTLHEVAHSSSLSLSFFVSISLSLPLSFS